MANRYLRGTGARNWNDTANWSDTSGGAGGFSVPTSADNVIFDNNSGTGAITVNAIANMLDFTCSNIGALTLSNAAYAFNVYGSLTLHTSLTVTFTSTGYLYMKATDSRAITTNGKVANWNRLYFDGVGGTWTNQDNMNTTGKLYLANGSLLTNSFTHTWVGFETATGAKTLTLSNSIINCTGQWSAHVAVGGLALNSGTSTINIPNNDFYGGGKIYYNVNLTKLGSQYCASSDTFTNLTKIGGASVADGISLGANIIVTNTLTVTGNNASNYRLSIASLNIGTARTITCNGTITASNVDFRDITLAGTCNKDLSGITGGSGDCGGNSGITFTTAQQQFYKHTSGACTWKDATKWFSNVEKTIGGRVPLPQDDATFDATSFTGTSTLTVDCPRIGRSLDMSAVNQAVTFSYNTILECYGSYLLSNNIQPSGTGFLFLMGRNTTFYFRNPINIGMYDYYDININSVNGTYIIQNHIKLFRSFKVISGTFNLNGYNLTCGDPSVANGDISFGAGSSSYLGNGRITLHRSISADSIECSPTSNIYCEGSTIILNPTSGANNPRFNGAGKVFNKIQFSGSHTGNFDISGSNTIAELIIDSGRKVRFTAGTTQNIAKATIGTGATISSVTAATHTLNYTGSDVVEADGGITVANSIATPDEKWYAGDGSTDGGGNSGWIFDTAFTPKIMWID